MICLNKKGIKQKTPLFKKRQGKYPKTHNIVITEFSSYIFKSPYYHDRLRIHHATFCQEPKFDSGERVSSVERMHTCDNY